MVEEKDNDDLQFTDSQMVFEILQELRKDFSKFDKRLHGLETLLRNYNGLNEKVDYVNKEVGKIKKRVNTLEDDNVKFKKLDDDVAEIRTINKAKRQFFQDWKGRILFAATFIGLIISILKHFI